jgi:hypothetical protein
MDKRTKVKNGQLTMKNGIKGGKLPITNYQLPITRQRGSALVLSMLVVAAVSAAAFGISRIFLADVRMAASTESSLKSFYLAEAGVEEGLLRYRVDRNNLNLNNANASRSLTEGSYRMATTFLTTGDLSTVIDAAHAFDTLRESTDGNSDFPNGDVPDAQTVEIYADSNAGDVTVKWQWSGSLPPADCGVEITSVRSNGAFDKVLIAPSQTTGTSPSASRAAIRAKPLCGTLDWLAFGAGSPIGRTIQTIDSTGTSGFAKRKLTAVVNRRTGSLVGIFDYVLGSEGDLIVP